MAVTAALASVLVMAGAVTEAGVATVVFMILSSLHGDMEVTMADFGVDTADFTAATMADFGAAAVITVTAPTDQEVAEAVKTQSTAEAEAVTMVMVPGLTMQTVLQVMADEVAEAA